MELQYEQDVKIDPDALDVCWLEQADLMRRYAVHAAQTERELDNAKENLDVGKAEMEMEIRSDPTSFGLEKVTEGAIQSTLQLQERYQKLEQDHIDAKYEHNVARAAVRAIEQRRAALENLVQLLKASYFAGPKEIRDLTEEKMKHERDKKANANVKMKRKRGGGE